MVKKILLIETSPRQEESVSRLMAQHCITLLRKKYNDVNITIKDLAKNTLPHASRETIEAFQIPPEKQTPEQKNALTLSDCLIEEIFAHEILIIASPMWNFSVPSVLKAWIDHIVRARKTFTFVDGNVQGLVPNKKVYLLLTCGSLYSNQIPLPLDFFEDYLKKILAFIGIHDVETIRLEGLFNIHQKQAIIDNAYSELQGKI